MVTKTHETRLKSLEEQMRALKTQIQSNQSESENRLKQGMDELQKTIAQQNSVWDQRFELLLSKLDLRTEKGKEGIPENNGSSQGNSLPTGSASQAHPSDGPTFPVWYPSSLVEFTGSNLGMFGTFNRSLMPFPFAPTTTAGHFPSYPATTTPHFQHQLLLAPLPVPYLTLAPPPLVTISQLSHDPIALSSLNGSSSLHQTQPLLGPLAATLPYNRYHHHPSLLRIEIPNFKGENPRGKYESVKIFSSSTRLKKLRKWR